MPRCSSCSKFVGLEDEAEVQTDAEYNDGTVTIEVRIVRKCAECGDELADYTFNAEDSAPLVEEHIRVKHNDKEEGVEIQVTADDPEITDRSDFGKNKKTGKPNKPGNPRYAKHMIGFSVDYEVHCKTCNVKLCGGTLQEEEQASAFDSLT